MAKKRMMIIDGHNAFIRHYIVNPTISSNGQPIGGIVGFLQGLQKLNRTIRPDLIVTVWDGAGGSKKRRSIVKGYKAGRKPVRLNRFIRNMPENEESENRIWQQVRVLEYLNETPVVQFMFPEIEADDTISYVSNLPVFSDWQKVIVSSDKDFFQVCGDSTILYRPIQDEVVSRNTILEKFQIHPDNFAAARAIAGDKSDNLPGVPRAGLATVAKRLPFLAEDKSYLISEILEYCEEHKDGKVKFYNDIIENIETVKINYKMMQLYSPALSTQTTRKIKSTFGEYKPLFNNTGVVKLLFEDGFPQINLEELYASFRKMISDHKL